MLILALESSPSIKSLINKVTLTIMSDTSFLP